MNAATSRRALLGSALLAPIAAAAASLPAARPNSDEWEAALHDFDAARARYNAALDLQNAVDLRLPTAHPEAEVQAAVPETMNADDDALQRIYRTAAPNIAAVSRKLEIILANGGVGEVSWVLADLRRSNGEAQS
ncbi:hypothetical protein [Sphingomonas jatrophae]|uniref:Uncharacterized protein n=1 Tax=Sphingomonas jatrophae TaxID=1166337 RepID=A0A1I6M9J8_9SPHN|nr:hypothetical protein [Sphingomonas jatrophae]SFS12385.1 hypothetical protein SAMN05192580_3733 [Sphingomonas jatrophae]